jgi:hypothetical protein
MRGSPAERLNHAKLGKQRGEAVELNLGWDEVQSVELKLPAGD